MLSGSGMHASLIPLRRHEPCSGPSDAQKSSVRFALADEVLRPTHRVGNT